MTRPAALLAAECERLQASIEHTQYWYSVRLEHLHRWAHTKLSAELRTEYFSIVANGHEDGAPPTYAQKMNVLSHARDKAEAECSRLQERVRVLEAALRPFADRAADYDRPVDDPGYPIEPDYRPKEQRTRRLLIGDLRAARAALEGIEVE